MKKFLAGTTALVAAVAVAGQAKAADPISIELGGFMNQWVSITDVDVPTGSTANYAEVITWSDTEVYFRGSTTLDNGLKVAVTIQDEQDRGSSGQDDVFMTLSSGSLGQVRIGATKQGSYGFSNSAPSVGLGHNDGDAEELFYDANGIVDADMSTKTAAGLGGFHNDGQKVVYISPSIAGFQVTGAYGLAFRNNTAPEAGNTTTDTVDYLTDFGIAYSGEFSGVSIGADVSAMNIFFGGTGDATGEDSEYVRGGLEIGVAGFTIGGSMLEVENYGGTKDRDFDSFDVGVSYATGPFGVSLSYINVEKEQSGAAGAATDETQMYELAGSYDLGAGVSAVGSLAAIEAEDGANNVANEMDGWGLTVGINTSF